MALLDVRNLHTHFVSRDLRNRVRIAHALNGVSFQVDHGEILGLVGETGAGKSLTAMSIMRLLRPPARVVEGTATFDGQDLLQLPPAEMNRLRGSQVSLIVQSPRSSLDPLARVGKQLVRIQRAHGRIGREDALKKAIEQLAQVEIPDPAERAKAWPHELSGGMAQRVLIAMALINGPRLLIADEPTTGLDVTVQAQILDLLRRAVTGNDMAAIVITHDLGVVAHYCSRVCVMFAGTIVEQGPVQDVFNRPQHPYTQALIASTPKHIARTGSVQVGGPPPDLYDPPPGCPYQPRCAQRSDVCRTPPPSVAVGPHQDARCHHVAAAAGIAYA